MAHLDSLGPAANLLDIYRRYPALARHVLGLAEAAFALTDRLSHAECELLGAYVSGLNGCEYCHGIHTEAAIAAGIPRAAVAASPEAVPDHGGSEWVPVYAYVEALTLDPASVKRQHVQALSDAGWGDDAIAQLAALCSVFSVLNRLVEGLGISVDPSFYPQAGKRLATVGYGGTAKMLGLA
jgi:uncharacterized peroxidase-related enzyme